MKFCPDEPSYSRNFCDPTLEWPCPRQRESSDAGMDPCFRGGDDPRPGPFLRQAGAYCSTISRIGFGVVMLEGSNITNLWLLRMTPTNVLLDECAIKVPLDGRFV